MWVDYLTAGFLGNDGWICVLKLRGQVGIGSARSHGRQCIRAPGPVERKIVAAAILAAVPPGFQPGGLMWKRGHDAGSVCGLAARCRRIRQAKMPAAPATPKPAPPRRILLAVRVLSALMRPRMSIAYQIIVCGSIVPDPLQTLEPVTGPAGPALKNEMMLPAILDPWASHALYEAANLTKNSPGSKVWLVSLGPKAKLQQVMMTVAQKVPFELVALDGPASGFTEAAEVAAALADAILAIPGLDKSKLLVFGGWESASRGAGATMQMVGERLGITDQFQGVDELKIAADGSLEILERIEGGKHQISKCAGPPALLGWATGNLPEPKNNPQVGMVNMRTAMPALQKAKPVKLAGEGLSFASVALPKQLRETKIVKDKSADEIAKEIVEWIRK